MSNLEALGAKEFVAFSLVALDPNNPRIAPNPAPGYDNPDAIFDAEAQKELAKTVYRVYSAEDLEDAVVAQGWTPIDPIIVWKHPNHDGFITVEGNTRVSVLRSIRAKLPAQRDRLANMEVGRRYKRDEIADQRRLVEKMEAVVAVTDQLEVQCVNADSVGDLDAKLPKLLGVRHILGTRNWKPYARNLYVLSLYEREFAAKYGEDARIEIDKELVAKVGEMVSMKPTPAREAIQAANAFGHFCRRFEDRDDIRKDLKDGYGWKSEGQYFFVNLIDNKYARDQFDFSLGDLKLSDQMEDVLYEWAFKEAPSVDQQVFHRAEDIRDWHALSRYDLKEKTSFAAQIDVRKPEEAVAVSELMHLKREHRLQRTPVNTLKSLLDALIELPAEKLHAQADSLGPMLAQIAKQAQVFLDMIGNKRG